MVMFHSYVNVYQRVPTSTVLIMPKPSKACALMQRRPAAVKSEAFSIVTILPWPRPEGIPAQAQQLQHEPMLYYFMDISQVLGGKLLVAIQISVISLKIMKVKFRSDLLQLDDALTVNDQDQTNLVCTVAPSHPQNLSNNMKARNTVPIHQVGSTFW